MTKWRNFEFSRNLSFEVQNWDSQDSAETAAHITYYKISSFRHFVTSFLLTCQPHKSSILMFFVFSCGLQDFKFWLVNRKASIVSILYWVDFTSLHELCTMTLVSASVFYAHYQSSYQSKTLMRSSLDNVNFAVLCTTVIRKFKL